MFLFIAESSKASLIAVASAQQVPDGAIDETTRNVAQPSTVFASPAFFN